MTDAVVFEERYISATQSSNLKVEARRRGDADYLIAVGLAGRAEDSEGPVPAHVLLRHDLASRLAHLTREWDGIKGVITQAMEYRSPLRVKAEEDRAKVWHGKTSLQGPTREAYFLHHAEIEEAAVIGGARAHASLSLKTLGTARDTLHRWAEIEATRQRYMVTDAEVSRLIGPVIEVFLDPMCPKCHGTGMVGPHGTIRKTCPACNGSTRRFGRKDGRGSHIGHTPEQHRFSAYVLAQMEAMRQQMKERTENYLKGA